MRKRNKCGLFLSLCMAVAWTTQAQTSADGYVIAVEGDDVYIDLAEGKIAKGDILEVCSKPGYFVHPVTKKRIRKESKRISSLIVKDVFGDYSTAKSVPSQTLESIQVGMPLKRIEMAVDSSANVGHIVAIDGTERQAQHGRHFRRKACRRSMVQLHQEEAATRTRKLKVQNADPLHFALSHFHYTDHRPMC